MNLIWIVVGFCAVATIAAHLATRSLKRKLETLSQSYWELRYELTRLRSQVARLDPEQKPSEAANPPMSEVAFVPLSTMRQKPKE